MLDFLHDLKKKKKHLFHGRSSWSIHPGRLKQKWLAVMDDEMFISPNMVP
jgi:hypothetical protein